MAALVVTLGYRVGAVRALWIAIIMAASRVPRLIRGSVPGCQYCDISIAKALLGHLRPADLFSLVF